MNRRGFISRLLGAGLALAGLQLAKPASKPVAKLYDIAGPSWKYGEVILHPKKITCLIKVPNELLRSYHLDVSAVHREGGLS